MGSETLHHRGLEVQRQQHVLLLRRCDLLGVELAQRAAAHHGGVDDLARLECELVLEHGDLAVLADEFDAGADGLRHGHGFLAAVEIAAAHVRHAGLGVGGPLAHPVRMLARVLLDRGGGAAVGVAFAQHRVHRAAEHLAVTRLDLLLGIRFRVFRIIRDFVSLGLQFLDRRLQLRQRCADIGQLDDVGFRLQRQLAQFGQVIGDSLACGQVLGEGREYASCQGNIPGFDGDAGCPGEGLDDRQQRVGCQRRRFVGQRVNNFLVRHDFLVW